MTRDGTVGRSDGTGPNLALHRDIDPARVMRTRFADPIRASSPPGLHQQAGHMTASDLCAARQMISCQAGAIHMKRRNFIALLGGAAAAWPVAASAQPAERVRRVGVLIPLAMDDLEAKARIAAFQQGLEQLGWTDGR